MRNTPRARAPTFSTQDFRRALGNFATGVTIVTGVDAAGARFGLTANSFNSVSLTPPLVLWSLWREASTMPSFRRGSHYAINILAADQRAIAERFATPLADRFEGFDFRTGECGAPVLEGAVAVFECFNRSRYEEGDHTIFVGEVERCRFSDGVPPLLFHGGRFYTELPL